MALLYSQLLLKVQQVGQTFLFVFGVLRLVAAFQRRMALNQKRRQVAALQKSLSLLKVDKTGKKACPT